MERELEWIIYDLKQQLQTAQSELVRLKQENERLKDRVSELGSAVKRYIDEATDYD